MSDFHNTAYGANFFGRQLPQLIKNIERLAAATETSNEIAASKTENSEPATTCYGFNKFKNILADNISLMGITEFVQNNDDETISDELCDIFHELLASEGCCPDCNMALFYSDHEEFDFVCSGCGKQLHMNEVAPFTKTKLSENMPETDKSCNPYELTILVMMYISMYLLNPLTALI